MITGMSGTLVSEFFAERYLTSAATDDHGRRHATRSRLRRWRRTTAALGPSSSIRSIYERALVPLVDLFLDGAFTEVHSTSAAIVGICRSAPHPVVTAAVAWGVPAGTGARPATLAALESGAPWILLFNGTHLKIVDARHTYARHGAEFDLAAAADDPVAFVVLSSLLDAAARASGCADHLTALDAIAARSREASLDVCRLLRTGVLTASSLVTGALAARRRDPPIDAAFEQALTIVYRVLFLLFAEARGLVPMWHEVYRTSYSVESLRAAAERSATPGLWDGLRAISRLAHAGCRLGELRVAPFNGRLFAPSRTPLVERADLDDVAAQKAIVALTTTSGPGPRLLIPYRDLGVEELGGVYETLLDYEPAIDGSTSARRERPTLTLRPGSSRRKTTGSFYTPQSIADFIVRRTLGPLVHGATPDGILRLRIVDPAMGSGAFLVAACRFLAAAYERALVETGDRHPTDIDDRDRAGIRRLIAERCLYGVDANPMAVQLARLSLWLATLAADRPLTFLDHHLVAGNSLVGAPLSALRRPPRWHSRQRSTVLPLFDDEETSALAIETLPTRFRLAFVPDDTVEQVREKERVLDALTRPGTVLSRWKQLADAWCAPWFEPDAAAAIVKAYGPLTDRIVHQVATLPKVVESLISSVQAVASGFRFFHWELEFPEVFFDESGARSPHAGFDAVIGNPPWEMVRGDTGDADARGRARTNAESLVRFVRESGTYRCRSRGHTNQYQLFLERAIDLTRHGGRIGLVLPSGLLTDAGSTTLRKHLLSSTAVDGVVGFDNRQAIFPIHRSMRFVLLTATRGESTQRIECRFGERNVHVLDALDDSPRERAAATAGGDITASGTAFGSLSTHDETSAAAFASRPPVIVTPQLLARISPEDLAIPDLRTAADLRIVERAAALFAPIGARAGWNARFGRELNASDDRVAFREGGTGLAVFEGKHIEPFRVHLSGTRFRIAVARARERLASHTFNRRRLGYRDVAGATNRTTLIAAILPAGCVSTHTLFCLKTPLDDAAQQFLCGMFNSFVVNYLVRLRVGTHVTTEIVEALPLPTRAQAGAAFEEIVHASRRLATERDDDALARLNAIVARMFQLTEEEFRHVLGTFPLVATEEREAALVAYQAMG